MCVGVHILFSFPPLQVVNRVISIGEKAKWKQSGQSDTKQPTSERWVQFGTVTSSRAPITVLEGAKVQGKSGSDRVDITVESLREYLSLPTSEYSLLDPRWIERVDSSDDLFIIRIPLQDVIGVNLTPSLSVAAKPHKAKGIVTFVGSDASLGSSGLDESFKLNIVAAMKGVDNRRRLPRIDHIPGRPITRIQNWASNAKWPKEDNDILDVSNLTDNAPFPAEHVYVSHDGSTTSDTSDDEADVAHLEGEDDLHMQEKEIKDTNVPSNVFLECRVNITVAVKVPRALRVVPNPLLGYAGSLVMRAVLNGAMPNFVELLSKDFASWADNNQVRNQNEPVGQLFEKTEANN